MVSEPELAFVPDWRPIGPEHGDLVERMRARAGTMPDRPAFVTHAGESMTYPELLGRAAAFAPVLAAAAADGTVGVVAGFDSFAPVSVVASAIAGVRLVVADAGDPPERLSAVFGAAGCAVLSTAGHAKVLDTLDPSIERQVVDVATPVSEITQLSGHPDLLVSTSGSTSAPKIAILPLERWYAAADRDYDAFRQSRLLVAGVGTYGFLNGIVATLCIGGTTAMFDPRAGSTSELVEFCRRYGVTGMSITSTMVQTLLRLTGGEPLDFPLQHANLRGERVSGADLAAFHRLFPYARVLHMYASTEAGRIASWEWAPGDPIPDGPLPLGPPIEGSEVRFLHGDGHISAQASAEPAELLFRAPLLFRGYVGRRDDDAFVVDDAGVRWFRTGDLVTVDHDGGLRVHGRCGRRVKVAGQFVDLDDVAAAFERLDGVAQAAVTSFDAGGAVRLAAHLVPDGGIQIDPVGLRARLAGELPVHMVPAHARVVADPPLNRSGKIDHLALASWRPTAPRHTAVDLVRDTASPVEGRLLGIAGELIGRPVALDDDLVDAGMVSVGWVELGERLRVDFDVTVELGELLAAPTVRGIAALSAAGAPARSLVPITVGDAVPPVLWVPNGAAAQEALPLARALAGRTTFVPLSRGFGRDGAVSIEVDDVVDDVIEALDTDGPDGPMVVAAFSTACHHAQVVAARLAAAGREVPLLVLLDPGRRWSWWRRRSMRDRWVDARDGRRARRQLPMIGSLGEAEAHWTLFQCQMRRARRKRLPRYAGATLVVRSSDRVGEAAPEGLVGPVRVEHVDGDHFDVPAAGEQIAAAIDDVLAAALT